MKHRLGCLRALVCSAVLTLCGCASVSSHTEPAGDVASFLEPFPAAKAGQTRWVIALPARADEDQIQVELLPTLRMRTDCNHQVASAKVQEHSVPAWGYGYAVMGDIEPVISTLMACPANETRERDVPVQAGLSLRRYRSAVPIVFYTPESVTLQYRLWRVEGAIKSATRK